MDSRVLHPVSSVREGIASSVLGFTLSTLHSVWGMITGQGTSSLNLERTHTRARITRLRAC